MDQVVYSPYAMLQRRGSSTLVVAFAGIDTPAGKYTYFKSFHEYDALLLNCPDNEWFTRGVPFGHNEPSSIESSIFQISEIARDYDHLVFIGGSMGGYGAILLGSSFPQAVIIAMCPEIYPGLRTGFFVNLGSKDVTPPCLSSLFGRGRVDPYIFVGEKKSSDLFGLIETKPRRLISLRNCYHPIPSVLHNLFRGIEGLVKGVLDGTYVDTIKPIRGSLAGFPSTVAAYYLSDIQAVPVKDTLAHLSTLEGKHYFSSYLLTSIAKRFIRIKNFPEAMRYAEQAIAANPADLENYVVLAEAYHEANGSYPGLPSWQGHVNHLFDGMQAYTDSLSQLAHIEAARP